MVLGMDSVFGYLHYVAVQYIVVSSIIFYYIILHYTMDVETKSGLTTWVQVSGFVYWKV